MSLSSFLALFLSLQLAACTHNRNSSNDSSQNTSTEDGGQHGGGGHVLLSSEEEVRATIALALKMAEEPDLATNIFYSAFDDIKDYAVTPITLANLEPKPSDLGNEIPEEMLPKSLLPYFKNRNATTEDFAAKGPSQTLTYLWAFRYKIQTGGQLRCSPYYMPIIPNDCELQLEDERLPKDQPYNDHFVKTIKMSPIEIRKNGDCGNKGDNHAVASVDGFHPGAKICFSIENLRRVPRELLLTEILSLIFHEAAHLNGYPENVAKFMQIYFWSRFEDRFARDSANYFQPKISKSVANSEMFIKRLCASECKKCNPSKSSTDQRFILLYLALNSINQIKDESDPIIAQLDLRSDNGAAARAFSSLISNMNADYEEVTQAFLSFDSPSSQAQKNRVAGENLNQTCDALNSTVANIKENLLHMLNSDGMAHCPSRTESEGDDSKCKSSKPLPFLMGLEPPWGYISLGKDCTHIVSDFATRSLEKESRCGKLEFSDAIFNSNSRKTEVSFNGERCGMQVDLAIVPGKVVVDKGSITISTCDVHGSESVTKTVLTNP